MGLKVQRHNKELFDFTSKAIFLIIIFIFLQLKSANNLKNGRIDFERLRQIRRFAHGPSHLVSGFYKKERR